MSDRSRDDAPEAQTVERTDQSTSETSNRGPIDTSDFDREIPLGPKGEFLRPDLLDEDLRRLEREGLTHSERGKVEWPAPIGEQAASRDLGEEQSAVQEAREQERPLLNEKHIFEGEINKWGHAVGFHHEGDRSYQVIEGTRTVEDANGVYEAQVEIDGAKKQTNSSFFPRDWSQDQVREAIHEAFESRELVRGNRYVGTVELEEGRSMEVNMFLDRNDNIISAFPVYQRPPKS